MDRTKAAYKQGGISIIGNTALFGLKLWAGIISGSVALIADAWHTLSDSFGSVIVIFGAKLSSKKPDNQHPFGHGRWEHIASIFIAFLLGLIAYDFLIQSITKFQTGESANFGIIAIIVTILSIISKEALAQYAFYLYRKTDNSSLKADAWHHRTDALSSAIVLAGIFLKDYFWWIDSALGFIISIMIFYATYSILKESISKLLGEKPSEKLKEKILEIINEEQDFELFPHYFVIHDYGQHKELTFHIKLKPDCTIEKGHEIATQIEKTIKNRLEIVTTIHLEPHDLIH
jgi:cation diffusion facilitator family transporter